MHINIETDQKFQALEPLHVKWALGIIKGGTNSFTKAVHDDLKYQLKYKYPVLFNLMPSPCEINNESFHYGYGEK